MSKLFSVLLFIQIYSCGSNSLLFLISFFQSIHQSQEASLRRLSIILIALVSQMEKEMHCWGQSITDTRALHQWKQIWKHNVHGIAGGPDHEGLPQLSHDQATYTSEALDYSAITSTSLCLQHSPTIKRFLATTLVTPARYSPTT